LLPFRKGGTSSKNVNQNKTVRRPNVCGDSIVFGRTPLILSIF
jgi:hypothetical protein